MGFKYIKRASLLPLRGGAQAGFSLIEMVVTLLILVEIMVAALLLFDQTNRVARSQGDLAEVQQQHRLAQRELVELVKMAGAGGLPAKLDIATAQLFTFPVADQITRPGVLPTGVGITVLNNLADNTQIASTAGSPAVLGNTDVLVMRGVMRGNAAYFQSTDLVDTDADGTYLVTVSPTMPSGATQDLEPLRAALTTAVAASAPEALIVRSTINPTAYAVLELNPGQTIVGSAGDPITVGLRRGATYAVEYGNLTRGNELLGGSAGDTVGGITLPAEVGSLAIFEEYRYYIRREFEIPGDAGSRLAPVLARARVYPGTNVLHPDATGTVDIADNIIDLQVALGVDHLLTAGATDNQILDNDDQNDEVLYNHGQDLDGLANIVASPWARADATIHFLRISTLALSGQEDRDYVPQEVGDLEDHDYDTDANFSTLLGYKLRRRLLETSVDMRNLSS